MLDIQFIRENLDKVKKGVAAKQLNPKIVDQVVKLYGQWTEKLEIYQEIRQQRNKIAKESKGYSEVGKQLKQKLKSAEFQVHDSSKKYHQLALKIPNLPADDVPEGKDESENKVERKWGKLTTFTFKPKDHLELGEQLDIIDVKRAAKVSGSRFGYLKGDGALLELALVSFAMETLVKEGFVPVIPPTLIKKESMRGMGYLEHGGEEDMYVLEKDNMVLVGTSEQSIGPMHTNEILAGKDLPLRYVSFSSCFRREAGSYGKDTRGILRVHQFDKIEMFSYCHPNQSDREHEFLLELEEKLFQALKIPYQVVKMCTGDLGAPAARKYDLEAWMPGQNKYREVTSTSTTTDFQARRLNIKFQKKGKNDFVHTLNGTAFAIGRTIIAILENYQTSDGSIKIPEVLQKYLGKKVITASK